MEPITVPTKTYWSIESVFFDRIIPAWAIPVAGV
jgi:hypothetical protein